jgi:hypothetical protein
VGCWAGEEKSEATAGLAAWWKEKKGKASWARPCGKRRREGKRKREWAVPKEKKREKKNCIQIYLNLNLKFIFKWKRNNKTMQCGMKCTRPIFPYISFLWLSKLLLIHSN